MNTKFTLDVPNDLLEVVVEILKGHDKVHIVKWLGRTPDQYVKAKCLVYDFIDKVESMTRKTADNPTAYFPHGNSIDREE